MLTVHDPNAVRDVLHRRLEAFVERRHSGLEQRSEAWHKARTTSVGGSAVAAVMGMGYRTIADLAADKAGLDLGLDPPGAAVWWGTTMEPMVERVVEGYFTTKLVGTDCNLVAPIEGHSNSPDGMGVVWLARDAQGRPCVVTRDHPDTVAAAPAPVLFEFKCPHSRWPGKSVPKHYRPQIWSGMAIVDPVAAAVFVDARFRKCGVPHLLGDPRAYDADYHRYDVTKEKKGQYGSNAAPMAWGVIIVDGFTLPAARTKALTFRHAATSAEVVDLGRLEPKEFDGLLRQIARGDPDVDVYYGDPQWGAPTDDAVGSELLGADGRMVLPWKLFQLEYFLEWPREGFLQEVAPLIKDFLGKTNQVRDALAAGGHSAGLQKLDELFPRSGRAGPPPMDDVMADLGLL